MPDPAAALSRLTDRLAPLERDLHRRALSFLAERVFAPGATQPWRELVASPKGSPLGPAGFAAGLAA